MSPMAMGCMIWLVMSLSGVPIGMMKVTIAPRHCVILKVRVQGVIVFCGAVLGTSIHSTCMWLSASPAILRIPTTTLDFVVCQDFRTIDPLIRVRA